MTSTRRTLLALILVTAFGSLRLSAQTPAAPPAQTPQTGPAAQTVAQSQEPFVDRYTVGQARPPLAEGQQLVELTLDQAYALALEKNLDLKVARMQPILTDYQLMQMRAAYKPTFSGSYRYQNSLSPSNNTLEGVANL